MQITLFTDYSLRTLIFLAEKPSGFKISLGQLAEFFNMNLHHLQKVSQKLVQLGYLESVRGKQGGISLIVDTHSITIGEVVRQMEPSLEPVDCDNNGCPITTSCQLRSLFYQASQAFLAELDKKTLADVAYKGPGNVSDLLTLDVV